jgi:hypothetical protein
MVCNICDYFVKLEGSRPGKTATAIRHYWGTGKPLKGVYHDADDVQQRILLVSCHEHAIKTPCLVDPH